MKNKMLIGLLAVSMTAAMFGGCGNEMVDDEALQTQQSETSGDNTSAEDNTVSEVIEAEVPKTSWLEENNITFTEGELSIPVYNYARDEEGNVWSEEYVRMRQIEGVYSEPVIEVSEPDENGNVTYTVTSEIAGTWRGYFGLEDITFWSYCISKGFYFIDAYTGTVFPLAGLDDNVSEYLVDTDVLVDDTTYHVATGKSLGSNWGTGEWLVTEDDEEAGDDDLWRYEVHYTIYNTLTAVVPAEYDGLILAIDAKGSTEYSEIDTEIEEAKPFDTADIATTIFKNVNYKGNLLK